LIHVKFFLFLEFDIVSSLSYFRLQFDIIWFLNYSAKDERSLLSKGEKMNIKEAIRKRRTVRRFKQKAVSNNEIIELLNAGRLASCGGNMQRIRYIVIKSQDLVKKVFDETAWAALVKPKRNPEWGRNAPLLFVLLTASIKDGNLIHADAGAAIGNMQLCATDIGLGCCWIGAFKKKTVSKILSLPEDREALYLLAVGYPDESPIQEDIDADGSPEYYLDDNDCLHVPKYTVDALSEWYL